MQELWFLCMTCRLNVLYKCMKFGSNTSYGYQEIERTQSSIANDQRGITPKISKAELWFLCMTCCLNVLYKYIKFCRLTSYRENKILRWTDRRTDARGKTICFPTIPRGRHKYQSSRSKSSKSTAMKVFVELMQCMFKNGSKVRYFGTFDKFFPQGIHMIYL